MAIDNLDPFAEKEDEFRTNDIKKSKSRLTRRRVDALKKTREAENGNPKKLPFFKRAIKFFKDLPEREDRRKAYLQLVFYTLLVVSVISVVVFFITNLITQFAKTELLAQIQIDEATDIHNDVSNLLNLNNSNENSGITEEKTKELESFFEKSHENVEVQFEYACALLEIYERDKNVEAIESLAEAFLGNERLTFPTNAHFLVNLQSTYRNLDEGEKYVETVEKILALPDSEDSSFNMETFTVFKEKIRWQLGNYLKEKEENAE